MKKLLLFLVLSSAVYGQQNVRIETNGDIVPRTINGHAPNLPANSTINGVAIGTGSGGSGGDMFKADNLSGLQNYATARSNLGLSIGVNVVGFNAALGTPTSGTLTNATGLPISTGVSGLGTGVATFLANPTGANLSAALTGSAIGFADGGTGLTTLGTALQVLRTNASATAMEWGTAGSGSGDVNGPSSSTDNTIVRFDGTTGKIVQASSLVVNDGATGTFNGSAFSGSAAFLTTPRAFSMTGDIVWSPGNFDGSAPLTGAGTLTASGVTAGVYGTATAAPVITLDIKGRATAASTITITPALGSITGLGANVATYLATPSAANLRVATSNTTGSGQLVFGTSPTLVGPALGTPVSGDFSTGTFVWPNSFGNVFSTSSFGTDNVLIRADGTSKNVQSTGITVDDSNNMSGVGTINASDASTQTFKVLDSVDHVFGLSFSVDTDFVADKTLHIYTGSGGSNITFRTTADTDVTFPLTGTLSTAFSGFTVPGSFTTGDLIYASSATTLSGLSDGATGRVLITQGTGVAPIYSASPTITGITLAAGALNFSGNQSAAAWGNAGLRITGTASTFTDTSTAASGTATIGVTNKLGGNTIAATNTNVTYTNYVSTYIADPVAGTNMTFTNKYALQADSARFGSSSTFSSINSSGILTAINGAILGVPASIDLTNATGTASALNIGGTAAVATVANTEQMGIGSVDTTSFIAFVSNNTASAQSLFTDPNLIYNANTGAMGATTLTSTGATTAGSYEFGGNTDTTLTRLGAGSLGVEGVAVLLNGGALGTPSSGTVTNLTGTASININGTVGATTPAAGTFTTGVFGSATSVLVGTAGSAVGSVGFRNATSGTATLLPPTGALGTYNVTLPNAASTLPIFGQQITVSGPSAARTWTVPDASFTVARTDAANTFTGHQTIEGVTSTGATGTGKFVFDTSPALVTPDLGTPSAAVLTNATGTAASLTAGNATKWTTGRTVALTGDVTYTSGSLDGSGNVTGTATLANVPIAATYASDLTAVPNNTGGWTRFAVTGSDTSVTATAIGTNVTGLVSSTLSGSTRYDFEYKIEFVKDTDTAGMKLAFHDGGTGTATVFANHMVNSSGAGTGAVGSLNVIDSATSAFGNYASSHGMIIGSGVYYSKATSPVFSIQMFNVTAATTCTVKVGSYLQLKKSSL